MNPSSEQLLAASRAYLKDVLGRNEAVKKSPRQVSLEKWAESITPDPEMVKASREAVARGDCLTTEELLEEIRQRKHDSRTRRIEECYATTIEAFKNLWSMAGTLIYHGKEKTKT